MAKLIDVTKCIGCQSCVEACQKTNGQPAHEARGFDDQTFTYLLDRGSDTYVRRMCMHCEDPACASVCPVKALTKTAEGNVVYDPTKCMGCRYCVMACAFGVPAYEWHSATPRVRKCEGCQGRPGGPACAEACPTGATLYGEREALLAEARKRITAEPGTYFNGIFGDDEVGGTDVIFIAGKDPAALGLPVVPGKRALPDYTWQALKHIPDVVLLGGVLLGGMFWLTKRKEDVARAEGSHPGGDHERR
ncbi:MAG: 4Fe-4S dicluster domain-containing protein [Acidobacteria bacterium]|nr:4Fe-4S dicluster domain-containing protein [Acidobacteriota bacterium]